MITTYAAPLTHSFKVTVVEDANGKVTELRTGGDFGTKSYPPNPGQEDAAAFRRCLVSNGWSRLPQES